MKKIFSCLILFSALFLGANAVHAQIPGAPYVDVNGVPLPAPGTTWNYWDNSSGCQGCSNDVLTQIQVANSRAAYERAKAEAESKKRAEEEKKKKCENKAQKAAEADIKEARCKVDAELEFFTKASDCPQMTKASITIGGQGNVNGDINRALAAANIKVGAVLGGNISGTLEWNPNADCRIKLGDAQKLKVSQCVADAVTTKAELASCP